jgi:cellulose synthase/poly-beta-1,6-N-acetylglucosamine synthase-like glycosyltransferase
MKTDIVEKVQIRDSKRMKYSDIVEKVTSCALYIIWLLMVCFTVVPYVFGMTMPMNKNIDVSFITAPLVGMTLINNLVWLGVFIFHFYAANDVIRHQLVHISKSKKYTRQSVKESSLVSIIIPARNEENVIRKTVLNCLAQNYKNIEVIVVCHNSTDRTYEEANVGDSRVRVIDLKTAEMGKGIALTYATDISKGEYISILDADGKLDRDFIQNTLPLFVEGYAAVQGKIVASNREYNLLTKLLSLEGDLFSFPFMIVRSFLDKRTPLGGTGFIIRKDLLIEAGKFGNSLIDDFDLSFRLFRKKYRIAFAPLSRVYDEKPPVYSIMMRQRARWVKGHIDLLKSRVAEPTDFIGTIYWLSPIFTIAGLLAIGVASFALVFYIIFGYYPYVFSYVPFVSWAILVSVMNIFYIFLLNYDPEIKSFKNILYAVLLSPFSNYWYIVLVKAFFVKGWGATKTTHGFESQFSATKKQIVSRNI